ncbi:MAG: hypothetical protein [Caudoviricetes sp.]|nr:MAG: hypothetical protein [Caudoviricetes sp.]
MIAIEYEIDKGKLSIAGYGRRPEDFFSLVGWNFNEIKKHSVEYNNVVRTGKIYYAKLETKIIWHWNVTDLLKEIENSVS